MTVRAPIVGLPVQMSIPDGSEPGFLCGSKATHSQFFVSLTSYHCSLLVSWALKLSSSGWISLVLTQSRCAD